MGNSSISLVEDFRRFFSVDIASSPEQRANVFGIRYRVYCEEFGYEPKERFPDQQERDEFDDSSLHCLITHKSSATPAGCVRLVLCEPGQILPVEKYCRDALDAASFKTLEQNRDIVCEVSRLAVDGRFRRRPGEGQTRFGHVDGLDFTAREQRTFSLIAVAAYLSACALTDLTGRNLAYAMMEPFLPRLLRRSGIIFESAGVAIDYHGLRAPYSARTRDAVASMHPELRALYAAIHDEFATEYDIQALQPIRKSLVTPRGAGRPSGGASILDWLGPGRDPGLSRG